MTKIQGIYSIFNIITGKIYVGSSKSVSRRLSAHRSDLKNNKHANQSLQNSYNKYGSDVFEFKLIYSVFDSANLIETENELISQFNNTKQFDKIDREKLFNTQWANKTGCVDPDNYKKGISHHLYGRTGPNKGKIFTDIVRENMSSGQKGKKYTNRKSPTESHKNNISAGKKNIPWSQKRRDAYNARYRN